MIRSFRGKWAELILSGRQVPKGFPRDVAKIARRKLVQLNNAAQLRDLAAPSGNRLEPLRGGVPRTRIERLVREETPVTADTALRLARYFGTTASFWMGLQAQYDLERAVDDLGKKLKRIEPLRAA